MRTVTTNSYIGRDYQNSPKKQKDETNQQQQQKKAGETGIEGKSLWSVFLGKVNITPPQKEPKI